MITGTIAQFEKRLIQRGYTWEEVRPCIVSQDGDTITVDETSPAYPRKREAPQPSGPGTELKRLLFRFGITATDDCACNSRASRMDSLGSQWVRDNLDTVTGWLEEEARNRGGIVWMAFSKPAARMLVLRACDMADAQPGQRAT